MRTHPRARPAVSGLLALALLGGAFLLGSSVAPAAQDPSSAVPGAPVAITDARDDLALPPVASDRRTDGQLERVGAARSEPTGAVRSAARGFGGPSRGWWIALAAALVAAATTRRAHRAGPTRAPPFVVA